MKRAIWAVLVAAFAASGPCLAQVSDDNGEESFIQQAIPKILGRKPRGALEVQLWLDVDARVGRAAVVRSLMQTPEFVDHWTDVLVDMLHVQRIGDRAQDPQCFAAPTRTGTVGPDLAGFVRDQPPDTTLAPPGGAFNMIDLIRSAIALDDLAPIYRAYPVPLTWKFNLMVGEASVGDAFNHAVLNREPDCLQCHHSTGSVSGAASGWNRTWPAPFDAEKSVYGAQFGNPQQTRDQNYPIFRADQSYADPFQNPQVLQSGARSPWGMAPACGQILMNLSSLPGRPTHFADKQGNQLGLIDLAASFKSGSDTLKSSGLHTTPVNNSLPVARGDQALAYMTAEKIVEGVWKEVLGAPLTIANYFPRNQSQRDVLLELTDQVFNTERWSLRALITDIMTGAGGAASGYFNRMAPDIDPNSPADRLPMTLDPWVQKDPRLPDPTPDPQQHFNGQGELVHRYSVQSLLHSVASALGWPEPQRFPPMSDYPNLQLEKALGQFISDDYQGRDGVDFQGLLSWETQLGVCDRPASAATTQDWIDKLKAAVDAYNVANPATPLSISDVVVVLKDWLIGEGFIDTSAPGTIDPAHPPLSEADALAQLFGTALTTSFASLPDWEAKIRRVCGGIVESPQFMLAGIRPVLGLQAPKLRVCNPGTPCTYEEMCQASVRLNGYLVLCGPNEIGIVPGPNLLCPQNVCRAFSSFGLARCEFGACNIPIGIPILQGPPVPDCLVCGLPWVDPTLPTGIYINTPAVTVVEARGAAYRAFGATDFAPLRVGMQLEAGAVVRLRAGSVLNLNNPQGAIRTPPGGMPGKNAGALTALDRRLFESVQAGSTDQVAALLAKGARANARDSVGRTPLMLAADHNNVRLVTLLLSRGADAFVKSPHGWSAADFAARGHHDHVLNVLARIGATAKPAGELAHTKPDVEEPWYVFVGRRDVHSREPVHKIDLRALKRWEAEALAGRKPAPPLTAKEAKANLAHYMQTGFAREHPGLAAKSR
jgi:hypothetical protein